MHETESYAVDGLSVLYYHVESILIVHYGTQAHNTNMNIIFSISHSKFCHMARPSFHSGTIQNVQSWTQVTIMRSRTIT